MKLQVRAVQPDVNAAVGDWFVAVTVTDCDLLPVAPLSSVTVRRTV